MLTHFSISQQGESHIKNNTPCQDFSASCRIHNNVINKDIVLAAVSDGVGSCEYSQIGSETAVNSFLNCLKSNINELEEKLTDELVIDFIHKSFKYALGQVQKEAEKRELPFLEFDSTLTGVVYDGKKVWFGHIGDDGIVALYEDATYEMITVRHKGAEAHSLFPLRCVEKWEFGVSAKNVVSMALMTDGVLDYCVDDEAMNNRVYFPFLKPALTQIMKSDEQASIQKQEWIEYFEGSPIYKERFRDSVTDDISFVVIENSDLIATIPEVDFDFDKWSQDSLRRKKEIDEVLYGEYKRYKSQQKNKRVKREECENMEINHNENNSYQNDNNKEKYVRDRKTSGNQRVDDFCDDAAEVLGDALKSSYKQMKKLKKTISEIKTYMKNNSEDNDEDDSV